MSGRAGAVVVELSPELTGKQRRYLRSLAHALRPLVMVGHEGASDGVVASVDAALADHELIKVKVLNNYSGNLGELARHIAKGTSSSLVQQVGRVLVFFRPDPEESQIVLPS
ncbi:MAG: ribosome assembly RNA-binding protein YhbY [Myxococcota bacterium]|nr:ribosome assembly RNA-binding protein YhbY [Myxococcota bacterium]